MGWAVFSAADRAAGRALLEWLDGDQRGEAIDMATQACASCGQPMSGSMCGNPKCGASPSNHPGR